MLRVGFQQGELLVGTGSHLLRKRSVFLPEIRSGTMLHGWLERLHSTVFFIGQRATDGFVQAARR